MIPQFDEHTFKILTILFFAIISIPIIVHTTIWFFFHRKTGQEAIAAQLAGEFKKDKVHHRHKEQAKTLKVLDMGCGRFKLEKAFGIDFNQYEGVDFVHDLNTRLPEKFYNQFDIITSRYVIEHLGFPQLFLEECKKCAKIGGEICIETDNASYWRYHKKGWPYGNWHANAWNDEDENEIVKHKMMFQMEHLERLFKIAGIKIVSKEYLHTFNIDRVLPEHLKNSGIRIIGVREK